MTEQTRLGLLLQCHCAVSVWNGHEWPSSNEAAAPKLLVKKQKDCKTENEWQCWPRLIRLHQSQMSVQGPSGTHSWGADRALSKGPICFIECWHPSSQVVLWQTGHIGILYVLYLPWRWTLSKLNIFRWPPLCRFIAQHHGIPESFVNSWPFQH